LILVGNRRKEVPGSGSNNAPVVVAIRFPAVSAHVHIRGSRVTGGDADFAGASA
jgi:hypothetical protein